MFNLGENSKVRGSGHLILNALRAFTIINLVSVMVSSWAMIVLSGLTGQFYFFDTMTLFFVFAIAVFLAISEFNLFKNYFENNWPVLSPSHSLAWLGLVMVIVGCQVLSNLNKNVYSSENLGMPIWRLVLASGILAITFGFFNMIASVIFRDSKQGITARHIRSDGNLARPMDPYDSYSGRDGFSQRSDSLRKKEEGNFATRRITQMYAGVKNFRKSKIHISKPIIQPSGGDLEQGGDEDRQHDRASPIVPAVQRPPTALHPAFTGSSRYSEAHLDRF